LIGLNGRSIEKKILTIILDTLVVCDGSYAVRYGKAGDVLPRACLLHERGGLPPGRPPPWGTVLGDEGQQLYNLCYTSSLPPTLSHSTIAAVRQRQENFLRDRFEESPQVQGIFLCRAPTASLFAYGHTSGIVADLGHSQTSLCVIQEGLIVPTSVSHCAITGALLDQMVQQHIPGTNMSSLRVRKSGELPDGASLYHTQIPEAYFNLSAVPGFSHMVGSRLTDALCVSMTRCGLKSPESIVFTGGCANLAGVASRLCEEGAARGCHVSRLRSAISDAACAPFVGSSILFHMGGGRQLFVTRSEYAEAGAAIVHTRCP